MATTKESRIDLKCETCSTPFTTWRCRGKEGKPSFCSRDCTNVWQRRTQIECVCGVCSAKFMVKECYVQRGQGQFCSVECRKKSRFTALEERFRSNLGTVTATGCLPWVGYSNKDGYGVISRGGRQGPLVLAHRLAYEMTRGPIPDGLKVLHRCDNPPCCEPSHLFLGTQTVNMEDMDEKGRRRIAVGQARSTAKLTENDVREIRRQREQGGTLLKDLAAEYGVSLTAIRQIFNGRTWKHVTPE